MLRVGLTGGLASGKSTVAAHLSSSGLPTSEREVLITNGAQQALSLAASFFLQRGDVAVLENPTYPGAIDAANAAGARIVPLAVSFDGARVDALAGILASASPKLVYLNPVDNEGLTRVDRGSPSQRRPSCSKRRPRTATTACS